MTAPKDKFLPKEPLEIEAHEQDGYVDSYNQQDSPQIQTLLSWSAPGRPFKKRGRQYFMTALLIALLLEVIVFLFAQYLLMLLIASFVFVSFALATVPPHNFRYRISTEGVTIEDHFYLWQELYDFYFKKRFGVDVLHVRTRALLPGELTLTLGEINVEHVKDIILPYLPYREVVRDTFMEKSGNWLTKNFPLEKAS